MRVGEEEGWSDMCGCCILKLVIDIHGLIAIVVCRHDHVFLSSCYTLLVWGWEGNLCLGSASRAHLEPYLF